MAADLIAPASDPVYGSLRQVVTVTSKFVPSNVRLISSWISDTQGVWHAWHMYRVFSVVLMSAMHGILVTNACMFFETAL